MRWLLKLLTPKVRAEYLRYPPTRYTMSDYLLDELRKRLTQMDHARKQ